MFNLSIPTQKTGVKFGNVKITINRGGKPVWQWQKNFIWFWFKRVLGWDVKIPIVTGYPSKHVILNPNMIRIAK